MAANPQDAMGEFFDFGEITMPETTASQPQLDARPELDESMLPDLGPLRDYCPNHPNEDCLCEKLIADFGLGEPDTTELQPDNYTNFASWIPRYSKPERSCDYCRSKHLECWFTYEGQSTCSPCNALFRACSFTTHQSKPTVVMDTLHTVNEDQTQEQGTFTGIKALKSYDRSAFDLIEDDDDRPSRKTGTRFPRAAVKVLKEWMDTHADHPYPTDQEKEDLATLTSLNGTQITNWMANTRRRRKTRTRGVSPSIKSPTWATGTKPVDIPFDKKHIRHNGKTWDIMNPLERWQHSPPENEPARVSDIAQAIGKTTGSDSQSSLSSSAGARPGFLSSRGSSSSLRQHRAHSVTSLETGQSDSLLSGSRLSSGSLGSSMSHNSRNSFGSSRGKDRRRRRRTAANPSKTNKIQEMRPFQCTFCTDRFRTKYDWSRHEKSLHLSLEKWICAPIGPVVTTTSTGVRQCVYCGQEDPGEEHIETHNHKACEEKGIDARTFYRKDHLRQHLRLVHGCKMIDSQETWKSEATFIRSRCGFCKQQFTRWQDRVDHLSKHFRAGAQMKDWKGCRGLDPAVASQVTNAMPPYLIGNETLSPFPFSASNEATWGQLRATVGPGHDLEYTMASGPNWEELIGTEANNTAVTSMPDFESLITSSISPDQQAMVAQEGLADAMDYSPYHSMGPNMSPGAVTCWEILTVRLGQYVRQQMSAGIIPSDEDMQAQARRLIYEDEDSWNQTAADNQEWLELFKKAHGMPSTATDVRVDFDEDLGARIGELNFDGLMFNDNAEVWDHTMGNDAALKEFVAANGLDDTTGGMNFGAPMTTAPAGTISGAEAFDMSVGNMPMTMGPSFNFPDAS